MSDEVSFYKKIFVIFDEEEERAKKIFADIKKFFINKKLQFIKVNMKKKIIMSQIKNFFLELIYI